MLASVIPSESRLDRRSKFKRFKAAIKREENDACIDYPEREQARPKVKVKKKIKRFNS